MTTVVNLSFTS